MREHELRTKAASAPATRASARADAATASCTYGHVNLGHLHRKQLSMAEVAGDWATVRPASVDRESQCEAESTGQCEASYTRPAQTGALTDLIVFRLSSADHPALWRVPGASHWL